MLPGESNNPVVSVSFRVTPCICIPGKLTYKHIAQGVYYLCGRGVLFSLSLYEYYNRLGIKSNVSNTYGIVMQNKKTQTISKRSSAVIYKAGSVFMSSLHTRSLKSIILILHFLCFRRFYCYSVHLDKYCKQAGAKMCQASIWLGIAWLCLACCGLT